MKKKTFGIFLSPSCFAACGRHLSRRIVIVFLRWELQFKEAFLTGVELPKGGTTGISDIFTSTMVDFED